MLISNTPLIRGLYFGRKSGSCPRKSAAHNFTGFVYLVLNYIFKNNIKLFISPLDDPMQLMVRCWMQNNS